MADYRAIATVCEAVISLLRDNAAGQDFNNDLQFQVFTAKQFADPAMASGVSLFLYRVYPAGVHRLPQGRVGPDGRRARPQMPVDLHFLLSAWGDDASLQHAIVGWMMRTMDDNALLPAAVLNAVTEGVFHPDEAVEVVPAELPNEELLRLWADLVQNVYHLSVPYVARNVYIESTRVLTRGVPVQQRTFDYRSLPLVPRV